MTVIARQALRVGLAPLGLLGVLDVVHAPAAALARGEGAHLGARAQLGARVPGGGQVGVVERVLGAVVAAEVALAAQPARLAGAPVEVRPRLADRLARHRLLARPGGEGDGERRQLPVQPGRLGRRLEGDRLGGAVVGRAVERVGRGAEHRLGAVVVGLELLARDGPVLVGAVRVVLTDEPALVLAEHDVRVDQRAAAQPAAHQRVEVGERPRVEHPVQPLARVPQVALDAVRAAGEGPRRVGLAALEQQHAAPSLGEPVGADRAAEPRAHDDAVEVLAGGLAHPGVSPTTGGEPDASYPGPGRPKRRRK